MEKKFKLEFTDREVDIIYQGLMELPAKISIPVIETLKVQLTAILTDTTTEDKVEEPVKKSNK